MDREKPRLIFSVDVEDWPQSSWDRSLPISERAADSLQRLIALMAEHRTGPVTFFVLGLFAEKHPEAVRAIQSAGHEVACHGYGHEEIFRLGRAAFEKDLRRATGVLGDLLGVQPRGYRAPDFSLVGESLWAFEVLAEFGYQYDSSVFPIQKKRYGIPGWPRTVRRVELGNGKEITEFPLTTLEVVHRRLPISGGGYARFLPGWLLCRLLRAAAHSQPVPPVFYCHPYEIDTEEFRGLPFPIPLRVRAHQGFGRRTFSQKLAMLFRQFECVSFDSTLGSLPPLEPIDPTPFALDMGCVERPTIF